MLLQAVDAISSKPTHPSLQAVGASERVFQLLDRAPQMVPAGKAKPSGSPDGGEVQFCNVHFSYPSRPDVQARSLICVDGCREGQRGVPSSGLLQNVQTAVLQLWFAACPGAGKSCPVLVWMLEP